MRDRVFDIDGNVIPCMFRLATSHHPFLFPAIIRLRKTSILFSRFSHFCALKCVGTLILNAMKDQEFIMGLAHG